MSSFSLDCAEKFLDKVYEDLKSSQALFRENISSTAIYHLHQANEKMYKAIRCLLDYLFVSIPLGLTRIFHKCIQFSDEKEENMFVRIEKILNQKELRDPKQLDELFKRIYSHNVAEGFFKEIDDIRKSYEGTAKYIVNSIRHEMPNFSLFIEGIFKIIEDQLFQRSKNAIDQYLSNSQTADIGIICVMYATEYLLIKDDTIEKLVEILKEHGIPSSNEKERIKKAWKFIFTIFIILIINIYLNKLGDLRYPDFTSTESQNTLYNEIKSNFNILLNISLRNYYRVRTALNILRNIEQNIQAYQCDQKISYDEFKTQLENATVDTIQNILRANLQLME
ncbi:hypothetical protein [Sulfurisphaera ohwakuensis]|uniref:hypothetical protein n=1 Tax=Sulfurisphaera ohwakuensis TaxID=69656 RepID=UPI0036F1EB11